jgi:dCTP deaminase
MTALQYEALEESIRHTDLESRLVIMPLLDPKQIGPASVDLRLGTEFLEMRRRARAYLDPFEETPGTVASFQEGITVPFGQYFVLHPGHFVLGATLEYVGMPPHLTGQVLGRSSWGRMGLVVATAVVVQPGFAGCLTLEIVNTGPVPMYLYPGTRIAQLSVWHLQSKTDHPYGPDAKYQRPLGPQFPKLGYENVERDKIQAIGKAMRHEPGE